MFIVRVTMNQFLTGQKCDILDTGTSVLWHGASLTYERTLKENLFNKNISSFVKSRRLLPMWDWSPNMGPWTFSNYGWLIGRLTHYLSSVQV